MNCENEVYCLNDNIISPLGLTTDENFQQISNGISGLSPVFITPVREHFPLACISDVILNTLFDKGGAKGNFTKLEKMMILSIQEVLKNSEINPLSKELAVVICTTKGNIDLIKPLNVSQSSISLNKLSVKLKTLFKLYNSPIVISNACISGLQGLSFAQRLIQNGSFKQIIVVGGDIVSLFTISGFHCLNALSNEPCQPFDYQRKGINLGEAVASIILSNQNLNQNAIAKITGSSVTNDAHHISAPSKEGKGLILAINNVLKSSNVVPDFVSTHGTGTLYNDEMEAIAMQKTGINHIPMNSLKGYFGHTLGAAGILETIISLQIMKNNFLISSKGFNSSGVTPEINPILKNKSLQIASFLKISSGFGGGNAAVVFNKIS